MKRLPLVSDTNQLQGYTLVDDDIFYKYKHLRWRLHSRGYVRSYVKPKHLILHSIVANTPKGLYTDHINHNKLDNRRSNLRICTPKQNQHNRLDNKNNKTGVRGVSKFRDKYRVFCFGKYLGVCDNLENAKELYTAYYNKNNLLDRTK